MHVYCCSLTVLWWIIFSPRMAAEGDVWKETLDDLMLLCNRYPVLTQQVVPEIHDYLHTILQPQPLISPEQWLWSILERGSGTFFSHFAFCAPGDGVPQNSWKVSAVATICLWFISLISFWVMKNSIIQREPVKLSDLSASSEFIKWTPLCIYVVPHMSAYW
jgi:hypothetical protein